MTDNSRAVIGSNTPDAIDYAKEETDRLRRDYGQLEITVEELIAEASAVPPAIEDNETKGIVTGLIKRIRDTAKRINGIRELEKAPHYRRSQGVDQFFFSLEDRLAKRDKKARDGIGDVLQRALTDYDNKLLLAEQARRRAEAEAAEREAARLRAEQQERDRLVEEARLAAERARKPETTAAKIEIADQAQAAATETAISATLATDKAEQAHIATLARPADIMRNRSNDGTLSTMAREGYAEIENAALLDKEMLWPFISLDAKEKALRQWAKSTGHRVQMTGAAIGFRNKSVVR